MKVLTALRRTWSMPLLGKELVEQANRRRTYIVRMLYAGLLFFAASIFIYEQFHRYSASGFEVLGRGAELFAAVVAFQFFGVYLFLPAVMVSAITLEKERESLALLLITSLGPWQIILQKYFGRLVPMLTFLLLSMPLLAVSYSLGGLSSDEVLAAILLLGLCCLQVGAFCLMLSAYCITTSTAFVLSYLLGACVFFGPVMLVLMATGFSGPGNIEPIWFLFHFPPAAFAYALDNSPDTLMCAVWCSIPIAGSTLVFLIMARRFLISRAFVQPKSIVLKLFRALDGFYHKVNFGDVVVMRGAPPLPVDRPVAWWEVTRRAMGQPQYLFRILTAVMLPMLLIVTVSMTRGGGGRGTSEVLSVGLFLVWILAALLLTVQGASTFSLDRTRRRLDPLLVAPISTPDLVRQKTAALRRLIFVWAVPLGTIMGLEAWWEHRLGSRNYAGPHNLTLYVTCSILTIVIYLPLLAWFGLWIGMKVVSQSKAIIIALAVIVAWCLAAPTIAAVLYELLDLDSPPFALLLLSPASIIPVNEFADWNDFEFGWPWLPLAVNFAIYGIALWWVRNMCLTRADRYLGRA